MSERLIFSVNQATEYQEPPYDVPLDRVELIIQNDMPALRLVLNPASFKYAQKGWGCDTFLKTTYGKKENDYADALKNFSDKYTESFKEADIAVYRESDESIVIYLPNELEKAREVVQKVENFTYWGNVKRYEDFHGESYAEETRISLLTQGKKVHKMLDKHFYKISEPVGAPLCGKIQIIQDGNAVVGVDKFSKIKDSNTRSADTSVYAVLFYPKSIEDMDLLEKKITKAAYLTPDYYDEFQRPKLTKAEKRLYNSPNYYVEKDKEGNLKATEGFITQQVEFVLLREINIHDLKNLFKELEAANVLEPTPQIAAEVYNAIASEYRSPIKENEYEEDYDGPGIMMDNYYNGTDVLEHKFAQNSLALAEGDSLDYDNVVEELRDRLSRSVMLNQGNGRYQQDVQNTFLTMHDIAQQYTEGTLRLTSGRGRKVLPVKVDSSQENTLTKAEIVKNRLGQMITDVMGYQKGMDPQEALEKFANTHWNKSLDKTKAKIQEKFEKERQEFKENGWGADFFGDTYKQRLEAANRSEDERTGTNRHRVRFDQSLMIHNAALPNIPFFDRRSQSSLKEVNLVPVANIGTDYSSKRSGQLLFETVDMDKIYFGLEEQLQIYITSLEQGQQPKPKGLLGVQPD
jgi:hypothetical protein